MAAFSFTSFAFRASTVGRGEERALVFRIDQVEKSRRLRSGLLAGQTSLLVNKEIFLLNPELGDLGSVRKRRVLFREPGNTLEVFMAQGSRQPFKMSTM